MEDKPIHILLVDDSRGDVGLTREALRSVKTRIMLHVASDGAEAMMFLHRQGVYAAVPRPDLILLDLNMPRKSGREVLSEIKADENLKSIPVVVLTTSDSDQDASACYRMQCNCFLTKPVVLDDYFQTIRRIEAFWSGCAALPGPDHLQEVNQ